MYIANILGTIVYSSIWFTRILVMGKMRMISHDINFGIYIFPSKNIGYELKFMLQSCSSFIFIHLFSKFFKTFVSIFLILLDTTLSGLNYIYYIKFRWDKTRIIPKHAYECALMCMIKESCARMKPISTYFL